MKFLKNLIEAMQFATEMRARSLALEEFRRMSDHQLYDIGISRDLLKRGVGAWPWRNEVEAEAAAVETNLDSKQKQDEAIRELMTFSNRELADLSISRAGITDAVKYGRPGIDRIDVDRAA